MSYEQAGNLEQSNANEGLESVRWEYPSELDSGYKAGQDVKRELALRGWSEAEVNHFDNAVDEVVQNAVIHGNLKVQHAKGESPDEYRRKEEAAEHDPQLHAKKVEVVMRFEADMVEVTVQGEPAPFAPDKVPDPTTEEGLMNPDGRGMWITAMVCEVPPYFEPARGITILWKQRKTGDSF